MVIELFGAPGAGKSTLAKAVACHVQAQTRHDLSAEWRQQSALNKASHIARGLSRTDCIIGAARIAFGCRLRDGASIARLARVIAKSHWLRSQHGLVLLDQGFLQDLWSVLYTGRCKEPDPAHLAPLLRSIYRRSDTRIVFIAVDTKTAFQRITGRCDGHSQLDSLPGPELRNSLERAARLPRVIVEAAEAAGLEVVTLDGSENIDVLAKRILSLLPGRNGSSFGLTS